MSTQRTMAIPPLQVPLAWRNLTHRPARTIGALAQITFAVVLMFVEMGFMNGLYDSQTYVLEKFNADLVIVHAEKEAVAPRVSFPRARILQARHQPGVAAVYPLRLEEMRASFKNERDRSAHNLVVIAFDPDDPAFLIPEVTALAPQLKLPDSVILDSRAKDLYGDRRPGVEGELSGRRVRVVGSFPLGPDFRVDGTALVSEATFLSVYADPRHPERERDAVEFGLVKLTDGADPQAVREGLERVLPEDVRVLTKRELIERVKFYWGSVKPVGYVFGLGVMVGFVIGVTICYQILFTEINDQLPQYATLKAIGHENRRLIGVVLQQGALLGVVAFVPGLILSALVYAALNAITGIPMNMFVGRIAGVFVLTVSMCVVAGYLAVGKALESDPAEVF